MKTRIDFRPFAPNSGGQLCLPIVKMTPERITTKLIPIPKEITGRHDILSDSVTESDVINALNLYFFPARFGFQNLPTKQRVTILDRIINDPANRQFLSDFQI